MTSQEFDKLFDALIDKCRAMRDTKGKEYANNDADRFANFKDIAQELGVVTIGDVRKAILEAFRMGGKLVDTHQVTELAISLLTPNPKVVLMIYLMKHVRSIEAWVKNGEISSNEKIEGRIVDLITYAGLLWGLENDELSPSHMD